MRCHTTNDQYQERAVLRRAKLRLPNLESLPFSELKEPILPMVEAAPEVPDIWGVETELPTCTSDARGDSTEESLAAFSGPEATPLIPWRARWARCLWRIVCFAGGVVISVREGDGGPISDGDITEWPRLSGGITGVGRPVEEEDVLRCMDCSWSEVALDRRAGKMESVYDIPSIAKRLISSRKFFLKNFSSVAWNCMNSGGHRWPCSLRQLSMARTLSEVIISSLEMPRCVLDYQLRFATSQPYLLFLESE